MPVTVSHDPSLDTLIDLDGQVLVVDPEGGHWVRFVVTRVPGGQAGVGWASRSSAQAEDGQGLRLPRRRKSLGGFLEHG